MFGGVAFQYDMTATDGMSRFAHQHGNLVSPMEKVRAISPLK